MSSNDQPCMNTHFPCTKEEAVGIIEKLRQCHFDLTDAEPSQPEPLWWKFPFEGIEFTLIWHQDMEEVKEWRKGLVLYHIIGLPEEWKDFQKAVNAFDRLVITLRTQGFTLDEPNVFGYWC